jgi:hypothetical protein
MRDLVPTLLYLCLHFRTLAFSNYIASDGHKIRAYWFGKDLEGSGYCLLVTVSRNVPAETEKNHKRSVRAADVPAEWNRKTHTDVISVTTSAHLFEFYLNNITRPVLKGTLAKRKPVFSGNIYSPEDLESEPSKLHVPVLTGTSLERKIFRSLAVPLHTGFTVYKHLASTSH